MNPITAVIIGAGGRGCVYAEYAKRYPQDVKIVGVSEPNDQRRQTLRQKHQIPEEHCFNSYEELFALPKFADAAFICTQDQMHVVPSKKAMERGYHLLLEKPISPSAKECYELVQYAKQYQREVLVCHVLRYTALFKKIKQLIDTGAVGEMVSMVHCENVGHIHQAHSFVRGNWRNTTESSPMILAKSCHDMDLIYWLVGSPCRHVSSFGSLTYFKKSNAPAGAPARCLDGCPHSDTCPYYAPHVYIDGPFDWMRDAVCSGVCNHPSPEQIIEILKTSPYGRCVFQCDNDVVDHQVVNLNFENGVTVSFTMCAFTSRIDRTLKIMGTKGEMRTIMGDGLQGQDIIEIRDFGSGSSTFYYPTASSGGHGGGDIGIMRDFVRLLRGEKTSSALTDIAVSAESHALSFAAEDSRRSGQTVDMEQWKSSLFS